VMSMSSPLLSCCSPFCYFWFPFLFLFFASLLVIFHNSRFFIWILEKHMLTKFALFIATRRRRRSTRRSTATTDHHTVIIVRTIAPILAAIMVQPLWVDCMLVANTAAITATGLATGLATRSTSTGATAEESRAPAARVIRIKHARYPLFLLL